MSEENTTQTQETEVNQPSTEASQNNVQDGMIPRSRLNEVNNKYKDSLIYAEIIEDFIIK